MTDLWTLREIEKDFLDIKPDANFMDCINACRRSAKEHITKLCNDMNLDEKTIEPGFYSKEGIFTFVYEASKNEHTLATVSIVAFIKYFFSLE